MEMVDVAVVGGGQSGLATARALVERGLRPVVLEASDRPVGSWPRYYDSLRLFSPARYAALPGLPFGGDPERYPGRDEVVDYLLRYAARLDCEIRTGTRVAEVRRDGDGLAVLLADGARIAARAVVAATGGFGNPHRPAELEAFGGARPHAAEYKAPELFADQRVVVVGTGNSAVQIAAELAAVARVTLSGRRPPRLLRQRSLGRDLHFWLGVSGLDAAPLGRVVRRPPTQPVIDDGRYRAALAAGAPEYRPMFGAVREDAVVWSDGEVERVDALLLATGYRPDVGWLAPLGALDDNGHPRHRAGLSTVHPRLAYVGLEWQRTPASAALRGVGRDAAYVARVLARRLAADR
ncbi:NAD(P)-binding domain-containing protein [Streptomyces sp. OF3]|uniref:NAD(P)-binding domain-containing protein n=1 Tax=Streptomyces alkaliterrae TaxID=2213162 RepID=A0A5P0YRP3_9ACTN|nr:NAD(P)-binding domain-containing protein [Streptomyces alkaliterrae]MBB1257825.1 NAD(P)-binding domain-containing protein [Streptomyces alkaliterrae]MQS01179.1 SidA/IucD/PvdA family monooxygenase [Streptomyces alkaliterrae]